MSSNRSSLQKVSETTTVVSGATKSSVINNSNASKRRVDAEKAALKLRERNNLNRQQTALRRQKEFTEKTQLWNEQILPKWNELSQSPKVRELCSKGIPPNIRGKVWPLLIGNELQVDEKLFEDLNRKVLLIYGNKVAANMRKRSGDTNDDDDENGMHKDSTYKVYKDSFSSVEDNDGDDFFSLDRSPRSASDSLDHQQQLDAAARAISADIPIPLLHQRLTAHSLRGSALLKGGINKNVQPSSSHAAHLDITEESWFQNERNGSLDSETFELIQKQLFKRGGDGGVDDLAGAGPSSFQYMDFEEEEDDVARSGGTGGEEQLGEGVAHSSYAESEGNSVRRAGIAAMCGTDSVDSHFTLPSYNLIGSYCAPNQPLVVPADTSHETSSHPISLMLPLAVSGAEQHPESSDCDLDEMSFALATGGDTMSSRGIGSRPQSLNSPGTPFLELSVPTLSVPPPLDGVGGSPPSHTYCSESLLVGSMGQFTPPPRRRHSKGYLIDAGLIVGVEEGNEEEQTQSSLAATKGINGDATPESSPHTATPLRTILPFPVTGHQPGSGRPPMPPSKQLFPHAKKDVGTEVILSDVVSSVENDNEKSPEGWAEPKRRTSVSALTAQFQVMESLAVLAEQQKAADAKNTNESLKTEKEDWSKAQRSAKTDGTQITPSGEEVGSASDAKLLNTMCLIEWDLPRTFPTLGFFHDGGPMHTGLERILLCYACFRPEIGYVQGMSFLVATLLLYMDEFEAFKCLANLLGRRVNTDFYRLKKEAIDSYVRCFDHFFKKSLPLLYQHMSSEGVTSEMFLMDWNMALFTKALPLEVAAQVWDMYLFEGEMYIMCVGLGILKMFAPKLSTFGVEQISPFLLHLPERINPEELFLNVSQIQIPKKTYERVRKKMAEEARIEQEHQNGLRRNKSAGNLQQHGTHAESTDHKSTFPLGSSIKRALLDARDNLIGTGTLTPPPQSSPPHTAHKKLTLDTNDLASANSGSTEGLTDTVSNNSSTEKNHTSKRRGSSTTGQKKSGLECLQS